MWHYKQTKKWWTFIEHNILKLLFIEIHNFKKKILEEDEDDSSDQQSDAEQTGNKAHVKNTLFAFLECSQNCTVPGEGYIWSESIPTGVTDQRAANQETLVSVIRKNQCFLSIETCLTRNSGILIKFGYLPAHCKTFNSLRN